MNTLETFDKKIMFSDLWIFVTLNYHYCDVIGSLFIGKETLYYSFFAIIEIATTSFIVWHVLKWKELQTIKKNC
jgi:hypothetical protein